MRQLVDSSSQHIIADFTSSMATQTSPPHRVSATTQTSPQPSPLRQMLSSSQSSRDVFDATLVEDDEDDEARSSTSMTLANLSPSPRHALRKATQDPVFLNGGDMPPSYAHLEAEERQKVRRDYIRRWHPDMSPTRAGVPLPTTLATESSPTRPSASITNTDRGGVNLDAMSFDEVSREAVERWKSLKRELGFECDVIDRALESRRVSIPLSQPITPPRAVSALPESRLSSNEEYVRTLTPRLAREWASQVKAAADAEQVQRDGSGEELQNKSDSASPPGSPSRRQRQRSPRWQFYNLYNNVFLPTN